MLKGTSFHKLYALLRGEVRARILPLALVFVLASITAFGEKAPLLLISPLLDRVLAPEASEAPEAAPAPEREGALALLPEGETGAKRALERFFDGAIARVSLALYGEVAPQGSTTARMAALWTIVGLLALAALITAASEYAFICLSRWVGLRMVLDLRNRLASHLIRLPMRYHGSRRFGDLVSRVSSDVTITLSVVQTALKDLVQQPQMLVGSLVVAWVIAPQLTLAVAVFLPLVALPIAALGRKVRKRSSRSLSSLGQSVEVLTQMFRGIRTVKAFRAEQREIQRYREVNEGFLKDSMRTARAVGRIEASTTLISTLGFALLLAAAGWLVVARGEGIGDIVAFFAAVGTTYGSVKRLSTTVSKVQEAAGAADRLQSLMDEPLVVEERPLAQRIEALGSGIVLEDVSFTYPGSDAPAIDGLDLEVRPGETLALVGRSGAGKTTLIDLIARFMDPDRGRVLVDCHDLRDLSLDSWTALYAMVNQEPFLFHASLAENLRYGHPGATQAELEEAARAANIHDFIAGLPQGYETTVGDAGSRLSGGQRQRITIARAILKGAPLLLLDEATSALDSESEAVVQEALDRLMRGRTVIVIAHRLSTIRNADRIAVLDAGRLVELGSHAELLEQGGAYARLHAVQFSDPATSRDAAP